MKNRLIALSTILLLCQGWVSGASVTLMPSPFQTLLDANGNPVNNGKICTYVAGTSTPATTYSDNAGTPNTNPIRTDSAGRYTAYLSTGAAYKFVYQDASGTAGNCDGAAIKTQDNVSAVPASAANLDITGTAGEALTAGQCTYLSDGSGSKTVGQWFKCDSGQTYSSIVPPVGMVPSNISSGVTGTIRLGGQMTGLSVSVGQAYYIGTAGAITSTAPTQRRLLGVADSTSTLVLSPNPSVPTQPWVNDFRLTLTTATPVTIADVTAAVTIYASPLTGNRLDLPDSNGNPVRVTSAEFSVAVPASTSTMYDLFAFNNAGVATLEALAWTNDTTRATAVVRTNGRWMKSGDSTRLYLGSCRTTTVSGQAEDSVTKRYLWNYYNRVPRELRRLETTASWTYTVATYQQANASATNQVEVVVGIAEARMALDVFGAAANGGAGVAVGVAIGEDSTTTAMTGAGGSVQNKVGGISELLVFRVAVKYPAVGRHFYAWLEKSAASGTTTWYANSGQAFVQSGLIGWIEG